MGLDFIRGKQFEKTWSRSKNALTRPDLFPTVTEWLHRRVNAERVGDASLGVGDHLLVTVDEHDQIVASREVEPVAVVTAPPREIVDTMKRSCAGGAAIAVVEGVRDISNTVELSIRFPR